MFLPVICLILILSPAISYADESAVPSKVVKVVKGKKYCTKGWECSTPSVYCCNLTISDYFQTYQYENLFSKRNSPVAHAVGFWDYESFIHAAALFQPLGFGTTGNKTAQMLELSAFLGHVGAKTSCKFLSLFLMDLKFCLFLYICIRIYHPFYLFFLVVGFEGVNSKMDG